MARAASATHFVPDPVNAIQEGVVSKGKRMLLAENIFMVWGGDYAKRVSVSMNNLSRYHIIWSRLA
jgi:hypothetical protein